MTKQTIIYRRDVRVFYIPTHELFLPQPAHQRSAVFHASQAAARRYFALAMADAH